MTASVVGTVWVVSHEFDYEGSSIAAVVADLETGIRYAREEWDAEVAESAQERGVWESQVLRGTWVRVAPYDVLAAAR